LSDMLDNLAEHIKNRMKAKTILKEIANHLTDRFVPNGCSEIANALYHNSAYWPTAAGVARDTKTLEEKAEERVTWELAVEQARQNHTTQEEGHSR
jgi:hypothetical protein